MSILDSKMLLSVLLFKTNDVQKETEVDWRYFKAGNYKVNVALLQKHWQLCTKTIEQGKGRFPTSCKQIISPILERLAASTWFLCVKVLYNCPSVTTKVLQAHRKFDLRNMLLLRRIHLMINSPWSSSAFCSVNLQNQHWLVANHSLTFPPWSQNELIDWLSSRWIDWLIDEMIDWLVDRLNDWLIDWITEWLVNWLNYPLHVQWLNRLIFHSSNCSQSRDTYVLPWNWLHPNSSYKDC